MSRYNQPRRGIRVSSWQPLNISRQWEHSMVPCSSYDLL